MQRQKFSYYSTFFFESGNRLTESIFIGSTNLCFIILEREAHYSVKFWEMEKTGVSSYDGGSIGKKNLWNDIRRSIARAHNAITSCDFTQNKVPIADNKKCPEIERCYSVNQRNSMSKNDYGVYLRLSRLVFLLFRVWMDTICNPTSLIDVRWQNSTDSAIRRNLRSWQRKRKWKQIW